MADLAKNHSTLGFTSNVNGFMSSRVSGKDNAKGRNLLRPSQLRIKFLPHTGQLISNCTSILIK
jgi:hypothetical protein